MRRGPKFKDVDDAKRMVGPSRVAPPRSYIPKIRHA